MTTILTNPNGTKRKHFRNKTFIYDVKSRIIRTYTRSSITNEVSLSRTEHFASNVVAERRFNSKR